MLIGMDCDQLGPLYRE